MSFLFVARHFQIDVLAAWTVRMLTRLKIPLKTRILGPGEEAPNGSVVVLGCREPTNPLWHPWYVRIYDMRNSEHRAMFADRLWLQKAAFVIVVRKWSASKRRFAQGVRRAPGIIERMNENGALAA